MANYRNNRDSISLSVNMNDLNTITLNGNKLNRNTLNLNININKCFARKNQTNEYYKQCPCNKKYGNFCGKHKNYLAKKLIPITNNGIDVIEQPHIINNSYKDISTTNSSHTTNSSNTNNTNGLQIDLNNVQTLKKIIKQYQQNNKENNQIIHANKKMSKKKNTSSINPYDYYKVNNKYLTILDYLYDKSLKSSQTQLKNTFNYYKLNKFYKTKKILKKDLHNFYKEKIASLFETILLSYIYIDKIIRVQRKWKGTYTNNKNKLHGPAYKDRELCNNETDFYSFDSIKEIPNKYFFSYKDEDNFIYGFHIESFINLIATNVNVENPYNRIKICKEIKDKARSVWSKLNKRKEQSNYVNTVKTKDLKTKVKNKCINVLQKIDMFGYQTNIDWIMELSLNRSRHLFKSIKSYWDYKAGITDEVKNRIVPFGNPFLNINRNKIYNINKYVVLETILDLMDIIVSNGINEDDKNQGSILILMALNEINSECGRSNNWLI